MSGGICCGVCERLAATITDIDDDDDDVTNQPAEQFSSTISHSLLKIV